jgi:GTPase
MNHKAGFVNIIGLPNVGKSTLMNALVGERLSIITPKAQTTRNRILGIINEDDYQIVLSDTPGFIDKPAYKMQESMNSFVKEAMEDADVFLFITELGADTEKQRPLFEPLQKTKVPVLVLINKIDKSKSQEQVVEYGNLWKELLPDAEIYYISASENFNVEGVKQRIIELIPESEPFYDKDALTDKSERFFVSEIIREKILEQFKQEIPYAVQVEIESFKEEDGIVRIGAVIYTERETQKSIIIGKGGEAIKKLGTESRKSIETFLQQRVFLELFVKVKEKWRNSDYYLKNFGYKG